MGLLYGTYELKPQAWSVNGTPLDFGSELLPDDLDRISERLEIIFDRMPALANAGIKKVVNGPFTFGPDGNPLIGPVPGLKNYWTAVGVMAGFCQGGGVGLCMAEWIINGEPQSMSGAWMSPASAPSLRGTGARSNPAKIIRAVSA